MASCFSGFLIGEIFGGIKPILVSLSPVVSGDASNVEDNNFFIYSQFFVSQNFFTTHFCINLEKICLYLRPPSFVVVRVLFEPQL